MRGPLRQPRPGPGWRRPARTSSTALLGVVLAAGVLVTGCSPSSSSTAATTTTSPTSPPASTAATSSPPSPSPSASSSAPSSSPSRTPSASLPPPPVVDLCAAFDQPVPTLRETAGPGSATTRGQVAALQRGLKRLGFDPGPVDGWYGPSTTRAVTAFQRDAGLPADGVMGQRTWNVWFIDACGID